MIKIRALNEEPCDSDEGRLEEQPKREAQEAVVLSSYYGALELLAGSTNVDEATTTFEELLNCEYLQNIESRTSCPIQFQLRLGCLKSLSNIYYSLKPNVECALRILLEATELDPSNTSLWCRLGFTAINLMDYQFAKHAFIKALSINHTRWVCVENLVNLCYALGDYTQCLYYCAVGLGMDSKFQRGMVFRDRIFEQMPHLKESIHEYIDNSENLNISKEFIYEDGVKEMCLKGASSLIERRRLQLMAAPEVLRPSEPFKSYRLVELSRIVRNLHKTIKAQRDILRLIDLTGQDVQGSNGDQTVCAINDIMQEEEERDLVDDESQISCCEARRSSSDEKEVPNSNGDVETDTTEAEGKEEKPEDEGSQYASSFKKKHKRDLKWWQLEGKRRSQRVKGFLILPDKKSVRERNFGEKLRNIIPDALLVLDEDEVISEENRVAIYVHPQENYFGSEKESEDVKLLIKSHERCNIIDLISALISFLGHKTDSQWPDDLALEYLALYELFRSLTSNGSLLEDERDSSDTEPKLVITMLELLVEKLSQNPLEPNHFNYLQELYEITKFSRKGDDYVLRTRVDWLLVKYYVYLSQNGQASYHDVLNYLDEVETSLKMLPNYEFIVLRTPCRKENTISLDIINNKRNFVRNLDSIGRVAELYDSKKYEELVEVLECCLRCNEEGDKDSILLQSYLVEAYYYTNMHKKCLKECVKLISQCVTFRERETILAKCISLIENMCHSSSFDETSVKEKKLVLTSMVDLLIANDRRHFQCCELWTTPWCILHTTLQKIEHQEPLYLFDVTVPSSIVLLTFAHEYLSQSNNCLKNNGKLLFYTINTLVSSDVPECLEHEEARHCVEQAIFCLYNHPTKKSKLRYLVEHNRNEVQLELKNCNKLFEFYKPTEIPDYDTFKNECISSDTESLYQRILSLIPTESKPFQAYNHLKEYLSGKAQDVDESLIGLCTFPPEYNDIYYLIADYHFKSNELETAIDYYNWDLAINIWRFDSWAAVALAKAEMINSKLVYYGNGKIDEIIGDSHVVVKCFRKALDLEPSNLKLRIEFGSFAYGLHAMCSRTTKTSYNINDSQSSRLEMLLSKKKEFLAIARECFERGVQKMDHHESDEDDVWITHYMLGKVMEKLHPENPLKCLRQYEQAANLLYEKNAPYPAKINPTNPPDLSIEALEVYYRIHASIIKYVERNIYDPEMDEQLQNCIDRVSESPFVTAKQTRGDGGEVKRRKCAEKDMEEIKQLVSEVLDMVVSVNIENKFHSLTSSHCSSSSSTSSWQSSEETVEAEVLSSGSRTQSYDLASFCEKMRESEIEQSKQLEESRKLSLVNTVKDQSRVNGKDEEAKLESINSCFKDSINSEIITQCVKAFEECLARLPVHYKSFYRISKAYFRFGTNSLDLSKAWIIGSGASESKKITGLFSERKTTNFFNNIWVNPVDDLERPGSFRYHMRKTIGLLISVLEDTNDHEMLAELGVQLSKLPDHDKQYLYNHEREDLSSQAINSCVEVARRYIVENDNLNSALAIFGTYTKLSKLNLRENPLSNVLLQAYELHLKEKGVELEKVTAQNAFKYFQHLTWATKLQQTPLKFTNTTGKSKSNKHPAQDKNKSSVLLNIYKRKLISDSTNQVLQLSTPTAPSNNNTTSPVQKKLKPNVGINPILREFYEFQKHYTIPPYSHIPSPSTSIRNENSTNTASSQPRHSVNETTSKNDLSTDSVLLAHDGLSCKISVSGQFGSTSVMQNSQSESSVQQLHPPKSMKRQNILYQTHNYRGRILKKRALLDKTILTKPRVISVVPENKNVKVKCSSPSPISIGLSTVSSHSSPTTSFYPTITLNTSPFRAQSNIMVSPNDRFPYNSQLKDPLSISPPKAHSKNSFSIISKTLCFSSNDVIDLTISKSPMGSARSHLLEDVHPERSVQEPDQSIGGRFNNMPDCSSQNKMVQEKVYPLPPKKKRINLDSLQTPSEFEFVHVEEKNVEVITLD